MSLMTHDAKWRLLVGAAPVIGAAFFVWAAAQGEADVARSPTARLILAILAALGTAVAWWTAYQLRVAPSVTVARASALAQAGQLAGMVALRGCARALPDAVPLISPEGELCLWFRHRERIGHRCSDSVRPFLLVDDSGECIVLPAGADVTGEGPVPTSAGRSGLRGRTGIDDTRDLQASERLLRNGDRIHVVGRFVAASLQAVERQSHAAGLGFPVIASPGASQSFIIRIGSEDGEGGLYGMLAVLDCLVLVVASSRVAWSMLVPS
jgi:hypothetical protein